MNYHIKAFINDDRGRSEFIGPHVPFSEINYEFSSDDLKIVLYGVNISNSYLKKAVYATDPLNLTLEINTFCSQEPIIHTALFGVATFERRVNQEKLYNITIDHVNKCNSTLVKRLLAAL